MDKDKTSNLKNHWMRIKFEFEIEGCMEGKISLVFFWVITIVFLAIILCVDSEVVLDKK